MGFWRELSFVSNTSFILFLCTYVTGWGERRVRVRKMSNVKVSKFMCQGVSGRRKRRVSVMSHVMVLVIVHGVLGIQEG